MSKKAINVELELRKQLDTVSKALVRAVNKHGHDFHCSAARGLESECHCGWVEIKNLAKTLEGGARG
jgi:hypothetical protein